MLNIKSFIIYKCYTLIGTERIQTKSTYISIILMDSVIVKLKNFLTENLKKRRLKKGNKM